MSDPKILVLSAEKALVLAKLLAAFEPIAKQLGKIQAPIVGLRLADGSTRTLKVLAATIEDAGAQSQAEAGGFEEVELEFCHPTLGNCTGVFLVRDITEI